MKLSSTALVTAVTVASLLVSTTPVIAQTAGGTSMMSHTVGKSGKVPRVTAAGVLQGNIQTAIKNLSARSTNLKKRIANQSAKGWDVSAANAAVANLDAQVATLQGLVVPTDGSPLKTVRQQFQAARKQGWAYVAAANRALAKNVATAARMNRGKHMMMTTSK